jgi:hypothetical protein
MQSILKKILTVISFLIVVNANAAPQDVLRRADSLFQAGRYIQAFDQYEHLMIEEKRLSPSMMLKMAFIKEGLGQIDQALYYLNIYYLDTTDERALEKMEELANKNDLAGYSTNDFDLFISYYYRYYEKITLVLLVLVLFSFAFLLYRKRKGIHRPLGAGFIFIFLVSLLFYQVNFGKEYGKGIISNENTYVMSGPSAGAKVVDIISLGHRVETIGHQDVWIKIKWDGQTAYVRNKNLRPVRFL